MEKNRFNGPYIVVDSFDDWNCELGKAALERNEAGEVVAVWHVCPCGCDGNRRLPVNGHKMENGAAWGYSIDSQKRLTMTPSILDLDKERCGSHYFIREGIVQWC